MNPDSDGTIKLSDMASVYKALSAPMPPEAIQTTKKEDTHKGYDTTGCGYQFCINRMNEVLNPAHWRATEELETRHIQEIPTQSGSTRWAVTTTVTVQIGNPVWADGISQFHPLAQFTATGHHMANTYGDESARTGLSGCAQYARLHPLLQHGCP